MTAKSNNDHILGVYVNTLYISDIAEESSDVSALTPAFKNHMNRYVYIYSIY